MQEFAQNMISDMRHYKEREQEASFITFRNYISTRGYCEEKAGKFWFRHDSARISIHIRPLEEKTQPVVGIREGRHEKSRTAVKS